MQKQRRFQRRDDSRERRRSFLARGIPNSGISCRNWRNSSHLENRMHRLSFNRFPLQSSRGNDSRLAIGIPLVKPLRSLRSRCLKREGNALRDTCGGCLAALPPPLYRSYAVVYFTGHFSSRNGLFRYTRGFFLTATIGALKAPRCFRDVNGNGNGTRTARARARKNPTRSRLALRDFERTTK